MFKFATANPYYKCLTDGVDDQMLSDEVGVGLHQNNNITYGGEPEAGQSRRLYAANKSVGEFRGAAGEGQRSPHPNTIIERAGNG